MPYGRKIDQVDEDEVDETTKDAPENGGHTESVNGPLVVDAYDPVTKEFVGRYDGTFFSDCEYDENGEVLNCGESYSGTFTKADGTKEEFSFYGD